MDNNLINVYTGSEITVHLLKSELEKIGVPSIIKDKFKSGISAGFGTGVPSAIDLFIDENDLEKAKPLIEEFKRVNE
jgi:hypothetical protein